MKKYLDKKLFFILIGYMLAYHVVFIFKLVLLKLKGISKLENVSWKEITLDVLIGNLIIVPPIIIIILVITKMMINKNYKWKYIIVAHFFFSLLFGFLIYLFGNIYLTITGDAVFDVFDAEGIINIIYDSNLHFLGYVGFVSIIYSYYYIDRSTKMELQKAQLSKQLTNIKMEALKSQLNPHFLFNTLNSISALIGEDQKKAQDMIANLGDLLREILILKDNNLIPLHKEILILKKYIDIMMVRFSDHLNFDIKIEENINDVLVPAMLIQPIIENSLKHGYSYDTTDLKVKLYIYRKDKRLVIHIENNGKPLEKSKINHGIGIRNIKERLSTLYNHSFEFSFGNNSNKKGVVTIIKIPIQEKVKIHNKKHPTRATAMH